MDGRFGGPRLAVTRWQTRSCSNGRWRERLSFRGEALARAWEAFVGRVPWDAFVTLTFDPKRRFPVSRDRASREAFRWCGQAAYMFARPLAWLYATERAASGLWHAHALIAGASTSAVEGAAAIWEARNGRTDVRPVFDAPGAVFYASKFAAEDGEVVVSDTIERYKGVLDSEANGSLFSVRERG